MWSREVRFHAEVIRRRHRSRAIVPSAAAEPIVRLWILRMLVSLGGHKKFISQHGLTEDSLAKALGLAHWLDPDESDHELPSPESREFNSRGCLVELRAIHRQAEKQSGNIELPIPLGRNVARLAKLLDLSPADVDTLAFAVLVHNDPLLQTATVFLGPELSFVQVCHTLSVILGLSEADVHAALHARSVLVRTGLVSLDCDRTIPLFRKLGLLSNTFADQMVSSEADLTDLLRGKVNPAAPGHLSLDDYGHARDSLDILRPYLRHVMELGRRGVNVLVHGAPGTGKSQLTRALAAELGCGLFEVASEDDDGDPISGEPRLRAFRAAQSFFAGRRALIVFDEAEDVFSGGAELPGIFRAFSKGVAQNNKGWVNRALEEGTVPTLWLTNSIEQIDPAFIRRFDMVFELTVPPKKQRQRIVQETCDDLLDAADAARLAEIETLAPAVVTRAAAVVRAVGRQLSSNGKPLDAAQKTKALEHLISNTLEAQGHAGLREHDPNRRPELYDPAFIHADADLTLVAEGIKRNRAGRLCLYGPPGTGKTAYGRWLAEQLDAPLLVKRASDILSMWVGGSEKNLARAFREAEREDAVLLIDEVDSFLQDRRGAQRGWEVSGVNEMLTQMESFPGVFIASTNLMHGLDQAALRRFDLKVKFDFLAPEQSAELLRRHCDKLGLPGLDDAARQAVRRLRQLTPGDFATAMRQHRLRPIATVWQLVEILRRECAVKEGARSAMGFVH